MDNLTIAIVRGLQCCFAMQATLTSWNKNGIFSVVFMSWFVAFLSRPLESFSADAVYDVHMIPKSAYVHRSQYQYSMLLLCTLQCHSDILTAPPSDDCIYLCLRSNLLLDFNILTTLLSHKHLSPRRQEWTAVFACCWQVRIKVIARSNIRVGYYVRWRHPWQVVHWSKCSVWLVRIW